MIKSFKILILICFIMICVQPTVNADLPPLKLKKRFEAVPNNAPLNNIIETNIVRVGLSNNDFSKYQFNKIELTSAQDFSLFDKEDNVQLAELPKNTVLQIIMKNNVFQAYYFSKENTKLTEIKLRNPQSELSIVPTNGLVEVVGLKRKNLQAAYRGEIEIIKSEKVDNSFAVVNILPLNEYLRGVVPNEMPVRFGQEALKAQSIAARNYVLKPRTKYYNEYDICDSVACQVYFGANTEDPLADKAIEETENNVAMYDDDLILALYSSTAGGYTENHENAFSATGNPTFPSTPIPYLVGKPDHKKIKQLKNEDDVRNFYGSNPETFDSDSPMFRWQTLWTKKELEDSLSKTIFNKSFANFVIPVCANATTLGSLQDIQIIKRGVSAKVIELKIITDKNIFNVKKELVIRQIFQKNNKNLASANFYIDIERAESTKENELGEIINIKFTGGGLGHGVGMSQWGAGKMDKLGYKYDEIIQHYYTGVIIATPPIELNSEERKVSYRQTFFAPYKNAKLFVCDKQSPSIVEININGKTFEMDFKKYKKSKVYSDISQYIKKGKNVVTYTILNTSPTKKNALRLYIELKGAENG